MAARRPRICLISLSAVADDPRVRRQGDAFAAAGWDVAAVGLPGARSAPPEWRVLDLAPPPGRRGIAARGSAALRLVSVRADPRRAERVYWRFLEHARGLYRLADALEADVRLANDWNALPIAARLAAEKGGIYGYDSHELASEEYGESRRWRWFKRPLVCALERRFIDGAAVVSAVSAGIAERLDAAYRLSRPTLVIRNTPPYRATRFRPAGERVRVLYHGILAPGRGLEAAIDSVATWRPEFDLTIRGPASPQFLELLRARIRDRGVAGRVALAPPVPAGTLVEAAAAFDIGLHPLPGHSRNNEFALPNKFFEYVMAGLALCVSELPEMARLVRRYGLGTTIPGSEPAAIAAAINGFDRQRLDAAKRNSLQAARELCWEAERQRMLDAYGGLLREAA